MNQQEKTNLGLCSICPLCMSCPLAAASFDLKEQGCYKYQGWDITNKLLQINPAAKDQLLTVCLS